MQRAAVVVAGGSGTRMGTSLPKQFLPLLGKPILIHTLKAFWAFDPMLTIVLVLPPDTHSLWKELEAEYLNEAERAKLNIASGGASRCASVNNGLQLLAYKATSTFETWVAIHDGVRPFASDELLTDAFQTAISSGASVACVPVKASLRKKHGDMSVAVDRSLFWEVQTPQTFRLDQILEAFSHRPHDQFTDDASLFEAAGNRVAISPGSYDNIKITTPEDLELGELILKRNQRIQS